MPDIRKNVECDYCGAHFHVKFTEELKPLFCAFCGEPYADPTEEVADEEDDGDLDYADEEREEVDHLI